MTERENGIEHPEKYSDAYELVFQSFKEGLKDLPITKEELLADEWSFPDEDSNISEK